jgi:subtilisin inhibitor-like
MSWRALSSLFAALTLLSACGSGMSGDAGSGARPETELRVQYRPQGGQSGGSTATLTCGPVSGTHPRPAAACAALASEPDALEPTRGSVACAQIYGGPDTAVVEGTFRGRAVQARFNRTNGCEIDRWDRVAAVLELR